MNIKKTQADVILSVLKWQRDNDKTIALTSREIYDHMDNAERGLFVSVDAVGKALNHLRNKALVINGNSEYDNNTNGKKIAVLTWMISHENAADQSVVDALPEPIGTKTVKEMLQAETGDSPNIEHHQINTETSVIDQIVDSLTLTIHLAHQLRKPAISIDSIDQKIAGLHDLSKFLDGSKAGLLIDDLIQDLVVIRDATNA